VSRQAVVAYVMVLGETEKTKKPSITIAGNLVDNKTGYLLSINLLFSNLLNKRGKILNKKILGRI
jgi:hypothetical protein